MGMKERVGANIFIPSGHAPFKARQSLCNNINSLAVPAGHAPNGVCSRKCKNEPSSLLQLGAVLILAFARSLLISLNLCARGRVGLRLLLQRQDRSDHTVVNRTHAATDEGQGPEHRVSPLEQLGLTFG